ARRTMGRRIGTRMALAAVGSRKQPTKSIRRFASSRKPHGVDVTDSTHAAIISVVRVAVSIQPKIDAAATMNRTAAVVSMVSIETFTNLLHFSVRYQTRPSPSAHTHPASAPSLASNT